MDNRQLEKECFKSILVVAICLAVLILTHKVCADELPDGYTPVPQLCTYDYLSYTDYQSSGCDFARHRPQEVKDRLDSLAWNGNELADIDFPTQKDKDLIKKYPYLLQE